MTVRELLTENSVTDAELQQGVKIASQLMLDKGPAASYLLRMVAFHLGACEAHKAWAKLLEHTMPAQILDTDPSQEMMLILAKMMIEKQLLVGSLTPKV